LVIAPEPASAMHRSMAAIALLKLPDPFRSRILYA